MPKPKLILSWPYVEWGGAQTYLLDIARRAGDFDCRAVVPLASPAPLLGYLAADGVAGELVPDRLDLSPAHGLRRRLRRRLRNARAMRAFGHRIRTLADAQSVVHADFAPWNTHRLLAALAARTPAFVTLHTRLPEIAPWRRRLWRRRLRHLSSLPQFHLLASSRDCRDSLRPYLGDAACERVPIAYPSFDVSDVPAAEEGWGRSGLCERLGLPPDRLLVVVAAQFIERKGCWTFLDAAARLARTEPRLGFVWLGTADLSAAATARIAASPGAPDFRYIPSRLSGGSRRAFLGTLAALADIFVLPSLVEGLPLALGEAMALGKPVIASRINAVPEAVNEGENGLLVEPLDSAALAAAIGRLATSPELRRNLGEAARRTIATRFAARHTTEITLAAYRAALHPSSAPQLA